MATHTCEKCGQDFIRTSNAKFCDKCRFICHNCGKTKKDYGKYCDSCRYKFGIKKTTKKKCNYPGCTKMIAPSPTRSGYCILHSHGRKKSAKAVKKHNAKRALVRKPIDLTEFGIKESKIPYIIQICDICNMAYLTSFDNYMRETKVNCCSRKCQGVYAVKCNLKNTNDTSIEIAIEEQLIASGYHYQKQVPLCGITIVDFLLPEYKIVIYCDGDYWHSLPKAKNRDKKQNRILESHGYTVYRFKEKDIRRSPKTCLDTIEI